MAEGNNVIQFATIFDAYGCVLAYNSSSATIMVKEVPEGSRDIIDAALLDISKFDDTTNYVDGMAALCVADFIDDEANPIPYEARSNILHALAIMKEDKYIHQSLVLQKNNRSWHTSSTPNECVHFEEVCTHRGINPDPDRKGRRSSRLPTDYHRKYDNGVVAREQLVTPALETVFKQIPEDSLISAKSQISIPVNLKKFRALSVEEQVKIISDLQKEIA